MGIYTYMYTPISSELWGCEAALVGFMFIPSPKLDVSNLNWRMFFLVCWNRQHVETMNLSTMGYSLLTTLRHYVLITVGCAMLFWLRFLYVFMFVIHASNSVIHNPGVSILCSNLQEYPLSPRCVCIVYVYAHVHTIQDVTFHLWLLVRGSTLQTYCIGMLQNIFSIFAFNIIFNNPFTLILNFPPNNKHCE